MDGIWSGICDELTGWTHWTAGSNENRRCEGGGGLHQSDTSMTAESSEGGIRFLGISDVLTATR